MFLSDLFKQLEVKDDFDKKVIAAMVFNCLEENPSGLTVENQDDVIRTLIKGVCSEYEFKVFLLAASWGNDLAHILAEHLEKIHEDPISIYKEYIFKYLKNHSIWVGSPTQIVGL